MALGERAEQRSDAPLGSGELSLLMSSKRAELPWTKEAFDGDIGYYIARARASTTRLFYECIGGPLSLRPSEYSLLLLLRAHREMTPKQLSQALALPAPSLTTLIDRMYERGLIERVRNAADRRSQHIVLTEAGDQLTTESMAHARAMYDRFDLALTPGERTLLVELLAKVARITDD